jgi:hypothetical protein
MVETLADRLESETPAIRRLLSQLLMTPITLTPRVSGGCSQL